ncbi:hypothetical protein WJX73_007045 [Symbiochloris irregularis]|uniref:Uncharacterized protein n=1 Tax=Symbiochloris irregularis TaxID=706552 RepID=A0AAW1PJ52_9CHLO
MAQGYGDQRMLGLEGLDALANWTARLKATYTDGNGVSAMALAAQIREGEHCYTVLAKLCRLGLTPCWEAAMAIASKELSKTASTPNQNIRDVKLMTRLGAAIFHGCNKAYFTAVQLASLLEAAAYIHE